MGCSVVSVYNDEIIGKIGYPQIVLDDLSNRDFKPLPSLMKIQEINSKIQTIYGFTQSFATTRLFETNIKNKEYIVYKAGRFIILFQPSSQNKTIVTNPEEIMSFMVYEKLCIVGLNGGSVLLWDLQFLQVKLEILLPQSSSTISSIGLSEKYIFVTDSSRPHNIVYIYDRRTGKMLTHGLIKTSEPVLKSITVNESLHITAAADGLWFIRMLKDNKEAEIVRGMFKRFPKTSMLCLINLQNYIVSGGIDGYVYFWKIKTAQCVKAIKVAECQITAIGVKNKKVIVGSSNGGVKVYTFQILKIKETVKIQGQEKEEPEQDLAFIMIESYIQSGQAIAFAGSKFQPHLYFCLTRQGKFIKKLIPAPSNQKIQVYPNLVKNCIVEKLCSFGKIKLEKNILSCVDLYKNAINVNIYKVEEKKVKLLEERKLQIREDIFENIMDYNNSTKEICFVSKENRVLIGISKEQESEQIEKEENSLIEYDFKKQMIKVVNFVNCESKQLLCITSNQTVLILQRLAGKTYVQIRKVKHQNKVPGSIKIDQIELNYQQAGKKWVINEQLQMIKKEDINKQKLIQCEKIRSLKSKHSGKEISYGEGFMIVWK